MKTYATITALEVKDGDIVIMGGCRCRVSDVKHYEQDPKRFEPGSKVARYTLTSEPNEQWPKKLPTGYNGEKYGGNKLMQVLIESK